MLLKDKVIFITGGSRGIGLECVKAYLKHGGTVGIFSNDKSIALNATEFPMDRYVVIYGDVRNSMDIRYGIDKTIESFGALDIIHNNAGIAFPSKPLELTSEDEWNDLYAINLKGIFYTTKYGLPHLIKSKGCIINTSSLVGSIGQADHAAYAGTKGAIDALTKSMALDYAKYQIRVNAISPAGVWTDMLRDWSSYHNSEFDIQAYLNEIHPLGYCPEGDVVADACVFLASYLARFITGSIVNISGGAELGYRK